jgi:hypothetical protein
LATCLNVRPLWPTWPPLFLPDLPRRLFVRGGFFSPSLDGGLLLFELFLFQPTFEFRDLLAQLGVLSPQRSVFVPKSRVLPPNAIEVTSKRVDQGLNVGRTIHPSLESDSRDLVPTNRRRCQFFQKAVAFRTHTTHGICSLGVTFLYL